jgi:hypothetical protein
MVDGMTTQQSSGTYSSGPPGVGPEMPPPPRTWGAPVPAHERTSGPWSAKKIIISAAVAVVIVAGGTVGVIAATNHSSTTAGGGPGGGPGGRFGGPPGGFRGGPGGAAGGLANALHGDFVVSGSSGYTTDRLQTGTVTAVSATDITLASVDGYTQTYQITSGTTVDGGSDTIANVAKGNSVTVIAALANNTATATTIEDRTLNGGGQGQVNSGQGPGPGN